jgi:hypothetical protein
VRFPSEVQSRRDENLAWCHQFVLSFDQQHLAGAGFGGTVEDAEDRRSSQRHGFGRLAGAEVMREKQGGDGIACAIYNDRQQGRAQPAAIRPVGYHEVETVCGRIVGTHRGHEHHARPAGMNRIDGHTQIGHAHARPAHQVIEFELIGRDDVGDGKHALLDEFGNAAAHEHPLADIPDHRIAAIARGWICTFHPRHRLDHGLAGIRGAEIAGDHPIAFAQHATLLNSLHHQADRRGAEDAAAPGAIAGVIGELNRLHRPDLDADALQREHGSRVADVAIGNMGLDGENVHARAG